MAEWNILLQYGNLFYTRDSLLLAQLATVQMDSDRHN